MKEMIANLLRTVFRTNDPAPAEHRRAMLQEVRQSVTTTTWSPSRNTGLSLSAVNRLARELEQEGLVARSRDPNDSCITSIKPK